MNRRALMLTLISISLAGCTSMQTPRTVTQVIAADPELSTLNDLIKESGLGETLSGPGPFTIFAPTNAAFKAVPPKTMSELAANKEMLRSVLTFHVLPVTAGVADVKTVNVKTVNGANLALARAGSFVTVDDAMVTTADKVAGNGVVHVIDRMLLPPKR
ncbi:MAG TPA: fasciclin domain-containing protein [Burkholderiaceae bacterium]|nr:fasciclin domain-containing protein [Burkholderiaceae bacterium]